MRRWQLRFLGAGILAAIVWAIWRALDERSRAGELTWTAQPFPSPPKPAIRDHPVGAADATPVVETATEPWVEPEGDTCPATHPVKAKIRSGVFHEPGGQMYDRTTPDRCYRDAAAATADGLRASKR